MSKLVPQVPKWSADEAELAAFVNNLNVKKVWLPEGFEQAKRAIAKIESLDMLKDLADRAKAFEGYAREIKDGGVMVRNLRRRVTRRKPRFHSPVRISRRRPPSCSLITRATAI